MATRTLVARGEDAPFKYVRRTAGDYEINSTSWANVDTGLDLTLAAVVGDVIEIEVSGAWGNATPGGYLDAATIVGGSPITYVSSGTGTQGMVGFFPWFGIANQFGPIGATALLTMTSGDLSGGTVTVRLRAALASAGSKTLFGGGAGNLGPLLFKVTNLGPVAT